MPEAFENCIKNGGRVRTKKMAGGYIHICFLKGKSYAGEFHKTVSPTAGKKKR